MIRQLTFFLEDMEDKVQYQSEERLMDIKEHLQGLETKLNSLEHQHAQQQYINIDGLNNSESRFFELIFVKKSVTENVKFISYFRAIFMKLLTVALNLIHLLLWMFGAFLLLGKPFCQTRGRIAFSVALVVISIGAYKQREYLDLLIPQLGTKLLHIDKT